MTRSGAPVDSGRNKLYTAENRNDWSPKAKSYLTQPEAAALAAEAVLWLRDRHRYEVRPRPTVVLSRGDGAWANERKNLIHLGRERPTRWILLHEVAHLVNLNWFPNWDGEPDRRAHGAQFAHVYLLLIGRFCSVADRENLKASFREHNVRFRPKKTRRMTDEQRAAAAARLAASRPAPSPHRWTYCRVLDTAHGPVRLYACTAQWKVFRYTDATGNGYCWAYGTNDASKAITRAAEASALRLGAQRGYDSDPRWSLVDIASELGLTPAPVASTV